MHRSARCHHFKNLEIDEPDNDLAVEIFANTVEVGKDVSRKLGKGETVTFNCGSRATRVRNCSSIGGKKSVPDWRQKSSINRVEKSTLS